MSCEVKPRVLATKGKFRRTENISNASNNRQQYSHNRNHLSHEVLQRYDHKQVPVTSEASRMHANGEVRHSDKSQRCHTEPSNGTVRNAFEGQPKSKQTAQWNKNEEYLRKRNILPKRFSENYHHVLLQDVGRSIRSIFAARMKSLSVRPLTLWV